LALDAAGFVEAFMEGSDNARGRIARPLVDEADHRQRRLLRARRERTRRDTAEKRDELAPTHYSITASARASSDGGTVRPNMRAVVLLMTGSNLVDCSTGNSPGLAPLSTRPA